MVCLMRRMAVGAMLAAVVCGRVAMGADFSGVGPAMQGFVDRGEIAGIVTLVADKEKVLYVGAVGTSDLSRKMGVDDVFWIASMSKPMTAVGAAMLVDAGKLSFEDPVEKYLPEFKGLKVGGAGGGEAVRPITIRDLLTHTSGLGEYAKTQPTWTLAEFSKQLATQPLKFQPGTRWAYSTAGIDTVGRVVEVVSGMGFGEYMKVKLFEPLGMKDTSFWVLPGMKERFAKAYRLNAGTKKLDETPVGYMYGTEVTDEKRAPLGGAGLFSTAGDVAKVYQMMLNGGMAGGTRVLKAETVKELTKVQTGALVARPGMPWGYGFCVIMDPSAMEANKPLTAGTFGHGGAYGTSSWADPATGMVYVQMLERTAMGNPDNSPMHIEFQRAASAGVGK